MNNKKKTYSLVRFYKDHNYKTKVIYMLKKLTTYQLNCYHYNAYIQPNQQSVMQTTHNCNIYAIDMPMKLTTIHD